MSAADLASEIHASMEQAYMAAQAYKGYADKLMQLANTPGITPDWRRRINGMTEAFKEMWKEASEHGDRMRHIWNDLRTQGTEEAEKG